MVRPNYLTYSCGLFKVPLQCNIKVASCIWWDFTHATLYTYARYVLVNKWTTCPVLESQDHEFKEQCHFIEVAKGDIFMEQKMRFGLVLGQLAILKKNWGPIMSNF